MRDQKAQAVASGVKTLLTIQTFDDRVEIMRGFNAADIFYSSGAGVRQEQLAPRGMTRLIDTACEAIDAQSARCEAMTGCSKRYDRRVIRVFGLITDGHDNESYMPKKALHDRVNRVREQGGVCLFLGANQDAVLLGDAYGFGVGHSMTYTSTGDEAASALRSISTQVLRASTGVGSTEFTPEQRRTSMVFKSSSSKDSNIRRLIRNTY